MGNGYKCGSPTEEPDRQYINAADKPTKKHLKDAIEKIPLGDIN